MDNVEQLQEANAKLKERLNNAANFFREQKAQIEDLTKENLALKESLGKANDLVNVTEGKLNESIKEIAVLKEQLESTNTALDAAIKKGADLQSNIDANTEELNSLYEQLKTTNEIASKVGDLQECCHTLTAEKEELLNKITEVERKHNDMIEKIKAILI